MSRRLQLKEQRHGRTAFLSKPPTTNRMPVRSKHGPLPPTLNSHAPFFALPNQNNGGKRGINPKGTICKLYLINTFRVVGLWSSNGLIAGRARPHLFVYRGGGGRSSATQKPWAYFSPPPPHPRQLPKSINTVWERAGDLLFASAALSLRFWERKSGFQILISWSNTLAR